MLVNLQLTVEKAIFLEQCWNNGKYNFMNIEH